MVAGIATIALVVGVYQAFPGPVSVVHATPAHDINVAASLRKAGWFSVILVGGITLLAKDANVAILGGATIIAEELSYRHAHMSSNLTGQLEVHPSDYQQAGQSFSASDQQTSYQ